MKRSKFYLLLLVACFTGYIWLFFNLNNITSVHGSNIEVCLVKHFTKIPCPACGTTRSITTLLDGNIKNSLFINPIGVIVAFGMLISPFWIFYDLVKRKESLFKFYRHIELLLQQKSIAIPAILLIITNWIWNIHKGL